MSAPKKFIINFKQSLPMLSVNHPAVQQDHQPDDAIGGHAKQSGQGESFEMGFQPAQSTDSPFRLP
jgi:hypothetical protein